jgi:hypothetical protein
MGVEKEAAPSHRCCREEQDELGEGAIHGADR